MILEFVERVTHQLMQERDEIAHKLAQGAAKDHETYTRYVGRYEQIDRVIETINTEHRRTLHDEDD